MEVGKGEGSSTQSFAVDKEEIDFFSKHSETWWDQKGCFSGLHTMNNMRVPFIIDCVRGNDSVNEKDVDPEKPLEGLDILEVGCGGGILTEALAKKGCQITGIDASAELIKVAKHHVRQNLDLSNITYIETFIEVHAENFTEKYDVVVCSELLEHVTNSAQLLDACVKCLKPGGSIIITTFNKTFMAWWVGIILSEYILRYTKRGTHEWSKFISPEDVSKLLQERGCSTKTVRGMKFQLFVFPKQWYWSPNTDVNYLLHAVKDFKQETA